MLNEQTKFHRAFKIIVAFLHLDDWGQFPLPFTVMSVRVLLLSDPGVGEIRKKLKSAATHHGPPVALPL
jgi:hypothetical protein